MEARWRGRQASTEPGDVIITGTPPGVDRPTPLRL